MKRLFYICLTAVTGAVSAADPNLTFDAGYDTYELKADFAKGSAKANGFPESDLQLRMFPGIKPKSNSLVIANSERINYPAKGNMNPAQGTVSIWFQMVNYDLTNGKLQSFFSVNDRVPGRWPNGYYFRIIKNKKEWKDFIIAQIYYKNQSMRKAFNQQVQYYLGVNKWKKGTWHHIAVTWNKKSMMLYLDGKLLKPQQVTGTPRKNAEGQGIPPDWPVRKFADFNLPPFTEKATISIGNVFKVPGTEKTAFDRIQIFDRPFSATEIQKMYEAVFPPVKKEHTLNIAGIPCSKDRRQFVRCFMKEPMAKPVIRFNAFADLRRDKENLYVKFVSDRPCQTKVQNKRDGNLWEDDSFELHLEAPDEQSYQFIINGNNAVFDRKNRVVSWNAAGLKSNVQLEKNGWTAELTIPLKNLSPLPGTWKMDVCTMAATGRKRNYYRWSNVTFDGGFTATGEMYFLQPGVWFSVDTIGTLETGALDLTARGSNNLKTSVSYLPISGSREVYPSDIIKYPWKTTLPAGNQSLNISATYRSKPIYRYQADYYVDFPMELTFNTRKAQKCIELNVDFANAGGEHLAAINSKGISGIIQLQDNKGKVYSSGTFTTKKAQCSASIPFPENLKAGIYLLKAKAGDMTRTIAYRVPNQAPYIEKVSNDSTVPEPWTPVTETGKNTFHVWNRIYSFDGKSPFPVQITAGGEKLFIQAPQLFLNGQKAVWNTWKIINRRDDRIRFSGSGNISGLPLSFTSELWFDGMYRLDWNISALQKTTLNRMQITYTMPEKFAKFAFHPEYIPWKDGKVSVTLLPASASRKNNVLWLSGYDRGIFFWSKSNANWVNNPGEAPMTAMQKGKTVNVALNIISRKADLKGKASYTMVFEATPGRPQPKNFRTANYLSFGKCALTHYELGNTGNGHNRPRVDDASVYNGCYPRDFNEFKKHCANRPHVKIHMYTTPGHLSDYAPDFDMWDKSCLSQPGSMNSGSKLGIKQMSYYFCPNATDAAADLWCWWCKNAMLRLKNYNGLYFDLSTANYCENEKHGCAGIDAFGQHYISSDALGLRNFFLHAYKTCHKYGGDMMIHCHVAFIPMTHITDFFAPGENTCSICQKNFYYGYCEDIPPDVYQSDYNQYRSGVGYQFILQNGRAAELNPAMQKERKLYKTSREIAIHSLTPMLVHDINVWGHYVNKAVIDEIWIIKRDIKLQDAVKFHGYWEDHPAVKSTSPKTFASWYEWKPGAPYKCVIIAGNFTRNKQKADLKINFKKMGLDESKVTFYDLWKKTPLTRAQLDDYMLEGGSFMMIGIR